jgi:HK97 family phage portal protein
MDRFGARVFKNGMTSGVVVEQEQPHKFANDEEQRRFYDKIREGVSGEDNWHRVIGLPYGMKLRNLGVSPKDAQLIEGLTYQVQDVSRLAGVPPSLLMELSRSTFTNSEQQMLQFVQLCLGPWLVNIEQRFMARLLSSEERRRYKIKFLVDALLRTDLKTQNDALRVAVGGPWMTLNEVRKLKDLQPVEGGNSIPKALNMGAVAPGD